MAANFSPPLFSLQHAVEAPWLDTMKKDGFGVFARQWEEWSKWQFVSPIRAIRKLSGAMEVDSNNKEQVSKLTGHRQEDCSSDANACTLESREDL